MNQLRVAIHLVRVIKHAPKQRIASSTDQSVLIDGEEEVTEFLSSNYSQRRELLSDIIQIAWPGWQLWNYQIACQNQQ